MEWRSIKNERELGQLGPPVREPFVSKARTEKHYFLERPLFSGSKRVEAERGWVGTVKRPSEAWLARSCEMTDLPCLLSLFSRRI